MIGLTHFPKLRDAQGKRYSASWPALVKRLSRADVYSDKHAAPGFSLATYRDDRRSLLNVERVYAVGIDLDKGVPEWKVLAAAFQSVACFVHTTWSSTMFEPRARAFIRLSRPVVSEEYRRVYAFCAGVIERGGLVVDRAASDPSRFWFLPSIAPGGTYLWTEGAGPTIDVDCALAAVPPPSAAAPAVPPPPSGSVGDVEARAAAYLDRCEPAISGSGGHSTTFLVAQKLVRGFCLDEHTAYRLMANWNHRCSPPWSEWELRRKIRQAIERGHMPEGALRDAQRR